jgi:hypothetical protein
VLAPALSEKIRLFWKKIAMYKTNTLAFLVWLTEIKKFYHLETRSQDATTLIMMTLIMTTLRITTLRITKLSISIKM